MTLPRAGTLSSSTLLPRTASACATTGCFGVWTRRCGRRRGVNVLREAIETALNYVDFVELVNKEITMAKKKEEQEAPVPIEEAVSASVRPELEELLQEYREHCDTVAAVEACKKVVMDRIVEIVPPGIRAIESAHAILVKKTGGRSDIKAEKLLELGVGMDVIEEATVSRTWEYYNVERPKEKGG